MKAYRIKKRSERQSVYIANEPITSFEKPKFPYRFFAKVNKPSLYKPRTTFEVVPVEREPLEQRAEPGRQAEQEPFD
jgi:hypothetical protein